MSESNSNSLQKSTLFEAFSDFVQTITPNLRGAYLGAGVHVPRGNSGNLTSFHRNDLGKALRSINQL